MNDWEPSLRRLCQWARRAPTNESIAMPYGFATRVIAQWQSTQPDVLPALWERFACRAAFAAGLILLLGTISYFAADRSEVAYDYSPTDSAIEIAALP